MQRNSKTKSRFNNNKGLFLRSECDEFSYMINFNLMNSSGNIKYFSFIGKIIAKAILENVKINLCFNKLLYKLILDKSLHYKDFRYIDQQVFLIIKVYNSIINIKKLGSTSNLGIFYVFEYEKNGVRVEEELIQGGANKEVNDINDYLFKRLTFIVNKIQPFINEIKSNLFAVFCLER